MEKAFESYRMFINSKIDSYISELHTRLEINQDLLSNTWKEILSGKGKTSKNEIASDEGCSAILKNGSRKDQKCGNKICKKSITARFCSAHLKLENSPVEEKKSNDIDGFIFKKNKYGNFAFGNTGLILKGQNDHEVIGKQRPDGSIIDLSEEDIQLCKRRQFKYVPNYHAKLIEQTPSNLSNTIGFTSQIQFL